MKTVFSFVVFSLLASIPVFADIHHTVHPQKPNWDVIWFEKTKETKEYLGITHWYSESTRFFTESENGPNDKILRSFSTVSTENTGWRFIGVDGDDAIGIDFYGVGFFKLKNQKKIPTLANPVSINKKNPNVAKFYRTKVQYFAQFSIRPGKALDRLQQIYDAYDNCAISSIMVRNDGKGGFTTNKTNTHFPEVTKIVLRCAFFEGEPTWSSKQKYGSHTHRTPEKIEERVIVFSEN